MVEHAGRRTDLEMIETRFEGANDMKRRQFVLILLGTALLPACNADAAEAVVVYKDAS
jgi:hypothetical protein